MTRGFVYQGGQLLAVQQNNAVSWVHEDPVAKSKRVTNSSGNVVSTIELDPRGGDTSRSSNEAFQPRRFTSYDRDGNNSDEAMHRRYNRWHMRFDQPDPYGGSYDMTNPQSFNRYSYVQNDPVNFVDPSGLEPEQCGPGDMCYIFGPPLIRGGSGSAEDTGIVIERGPEQDPTNPGGSPGQNSQERNDCLEFVAAVDRLANDSRTTLGFVVSLFNELSGDREGSITRAREFRGEYTDEVGPGNSPHQVRHAVGGIVAGYFGGLAAVPGGRVIYRIALNLTLDKFNERDRSYQTTIVPGTPAGVRVFQRTPSTPTASQAADIRLNGVTVPLGFSLGVGEINANQLGEFIRLLICN